MNVCETDDDVNDDDDDDDFYDDDDFDDDSNYNIYICKTLVIVPTMVLANIPGTVENENIRDTNRQNGYSKCVQLKDRLKMRAQ